MKNPETRPVQEETRPVQEAKTKPAQKAELGRRTRNLMTAGGSALGILAGAAAVALYPAARDTLACDVATEVQFSPGGKYRVQTAEKTCRWGFQAADRVEVKIDKQAKDGWLPVLPLVYDGTAASDASPAVKWRGPHTLELTLASGDVTGALVHRIDDLTVTRRYVRAARK